MSWFDSGGFRIWRDREADSPGSGIAFVMSVYIGDGETVAKTDVQAIRREAGRALREQEAES